MVFSACAPGNFLSGTAGGEGEAEPASAPEEPPDEPPSSEGEGSQNHVSVIFYEKPTLQVTRIEQSDGTILITDVTFSGESMGEGNFQIEFPSNIDLDKSETVRLIIAPPSITIYRNDAISQNINREILQDVIEIYPLMHAELTANDSFSITTNQQAEQPILSNSASTWSWVIEPQESGEKIISLKISVPVMTDGQDTPYGLVDVELRINVKALPTPTPPPAPTSTPIPSVENQLIASASQITIALIGAITTIIVAIVGIWFNKSNKDKVLEKKKREEYKTDKNKRETKTRRGLDWLNKK